MVSRSCDCPQNQPKYVTVAESSHITQKGDSSVLEFTVPAHVPVDRIAFTPGAAPALFSRDVNISVAPVAQPPATDRTEPRSLLRHSEISFAFTASRMATGSTKNAWRSTRPEWTSQPPAKWTITIENGDDIPLTLQSVRLEMLQRNLCFEAATNADYTLFYGDPALSAPRYDYATLFTRQADAAEATLGLEQLNPAYQSRPDERPFTEKHPALLWVTLVGVIALLGGIALRSAKRATRA